jgi:hypothetical protein
MVTKIAFKVRKLKNKSRFMIEAAFRQNSKNYFYFLLKNSFTLSGDMIDSTNM